MIVKVESFDPTLKVELRKKGVEVFSYSRLSTFIGCQKEWYYKYVEKLPTEPNAYGIAGSIVHSAIEDFMSKGVVENNVYNKIVERFQELDIDITNNGRDNWHLDMEHLSTNLGQLLESFSGYDVIDIEKEFLTKYTTDTGEEIWLNGYIDIILKKDNNIYVYDWKTSSDFSKDKRYENALQLLMYKDALEAEGMKVDNIGWVMVKYMKTKVGKNRTRKIQRKDFPLVDKARLLEVGMTDSEYQLLEVTKDFADIPTRITEYEIEPYIVEYDGDETEILRLRQFIDNTYKAIQYAKETNAWEYKDSDNLFYCEHLCGYKDICPRLTEEIGEVNNNELSTSASNEVINDILDDIFG